MPKIDAMYAFIAEDSGPDDEGITAHLTPMGWMPMVGADMERMDSIREVAQQIATAGGKPIRLVKFETRTELETIMPEGPPDGGVVHIDPNGNLA